MVTPLSQIVGTQAAVNVIVGERYQQVTDQTIEYALGRHGREAPNAMDQEIRDKILNRPRARELEALESWEPTLLELRKRYGKNISDEDLILQAIVGDDALDIVGSAGVARQHLTNSKPLSQLIYELATRDEHRYVSIKKDGLSVTMVKSR